MFYAVSWISNCKITRVYMIMIVIIDSSIDLLNVHSSINRYKL